MKISELGKYFKTDYANGLLEIETPYTNHNNDQITVYIELTDDKIILSDDGQTINTLSLNGIDFDESKRLSVIFRKLLKVYKLEYDTDLEELRLIVNSNTEHMIQNVTMYIQALLSIDAIYHM